MRPHVVVLRLVGFLLAHHEQRNEVVLLPGFRAIAVFHPLELRRILGAVVLAEIPHLLQSEEPVVILTVRVFDEDGHGAGCLMAEVSTDVLPVHLVGPAKQPHDIRQLVLLLIQESAIENPTSHPSALEHLMARHQPAPDCVGKEDVECTVGAADVFLELFPIRPAPGLFCILPGFSSPATV